MRIVYVNKFMWISKILRFLYKMSIKKWMEYVFLWIEVSTEWLYLYHRKKVYFLSQHDNTFKCRYLHVVDGQMTTQWIVFGSVNSYKLYKKEDHNPKIHLFSILTNQPTEISCVVSFCCIKYLSIATYHWSLIKPLKFNDGTWATSLKYK